MDSIGVPKALSVELVKNLRVDASKEPTPVAAASISTYETLKDKIALRKTKDGWYALYILYVEKYDDYIDKKYFVVYPINGRYETFSSNKLSDVKPKFGSGPSKYWTLEYSDRRRIARNPKPPSDVDSVRRRMGSDDMTGGDIWAYANRVFLPKISDRLRAQADEIYAQIRSLPKNVNQFGKPTTGPSSFKTAREAALSYADALENLAERGFNREVYKEFLKASGRAYQSTMNEFGSLYDYLQLNKLPSSEAVFAELISEPNSRARLAKTLLSMGRKIVDDFEQFKANVK